MRISYSRKVKAKAIVKVKVNDMVVDFGTQIRAPENLVKILQAGALVYIILPKVKVNVKVMVKVRMKVKLEVKVKVRVIVLGTGIRFPEKLVNIGQARASE